MFEALLGKKFTVKCKHAIKCINERLRPIRNRKQAVVNILRKDAAELLRNGGDAQAFSRMDELIVEMNRLACYDMIDSFCQRIYKQLPVLQKQSDCPPEEHESVATLIFAAARFSDLPELCDLRAAFTMRYGSPLEGFVNHEFREKIGAKSFPSSMKILVMEDIACEFGILWNSRSFNLKNSTVASAREDEAIKRTTTDNSRAGRPEKSRLSRGREEDLQKKDNGGARPKNSNLSLGRDEDLHKKEKGGTRAVKMEEEMAQRTRASEFQAARPENLNPSPAPDEDLQKKKMDNGNVRSAQPFGPSPQNISPHAVSVRRLPRAQVRVSAVGSEESPKSGPESRASPRSTWEKTAEESEEVVDRKQSTVVRGDLRMVPPPYVKSITPKVESPETADDAVGGELRALVSDQRPKARSVRRKPLQMDQAKVIRKLETEDRIAFDQDSDDVDQLLVFYSKKRQEGRGKDRAHAAEADELAERITRLRGRAG